MLRYLLFFIFLFIWLSSCTTKKHYTVLLENANGLEKGSEVIFNGLTVGKVSQMKLLPDLRIVLSISMNNEFKLPLGSRFMVLTPLIGNTKLVVEKSDNTRLATKNDTLFGYLDTVSAKGILFDSTKRKAVDKIIQGFQELIEETKKDSIK